jgi:hypothetical protein
MDEDSWLRKIMSWVAVGLVTCMTIFFFVIVSRRGMEEHAWLKVTQDHFAAIVGLPASAVGALFLVLVLRMAEGPIEFEVGAVKFKGAAAPIVFWLLCFLGMASAIKMLWSA